MTVIAPGDSLEAKRVAEFLGEYQSPAYVRLCRDKTPLFLTDMPFEHGKARVLREGSDVALLGTGIMTHSLLAVADELAKDGVMAEVVHVPTIKPLDEETILRAAHKCGRVVTAEEGQIAAGFGGAVAELLSEKLPMPIKRLGVKDRFGQSGTAAELLDEYGLTPEYMLGAVGDFIQAMPKYHQ